MKFIRKNGHVIPISDYQAKGRNKKDQQVVSKKKAGAAGAAAGAAYHIHHDMIAEAAEKSALSNTKNVDKFKAALKPGDIIVTGATARQAGYWTFEDATDMVKNKTIRNTIKKVGKKVGLTAKTQVTPALSHTLMGLGAGKKYHAAVYVGNGKVAHSYPDYGVFTDSLEHALEGSNSTAYRFKNLGKNEAANAVRFAKAAAKKKVPYQSMEVAAKNVMTNMGVPFLQKEAKKGHRFDPMVCHTVAIRAYKNRTFAHGEHTFAGDFKLEKGLEAVARRDITKMPSAMHFLGQSLKGLKWGVAAAATAAAINYAWKKHKEKAK